MNQLFTIGQLSKLFNVKIPTLRYYDEAGLLKPAKVDSATNYRYYSTEQFERLNVIKYFRALNLSIESIKDFFDARDISTLEKLLREQQIKVDQQIQTLQSVNKRISTRLSQVESAEKAVLDQVELVSLPKIPVIYLRQDYQLSEDIELPLTTMRQQYKLDKSIFLGKIALSMARENLIDNKYDHYNGILLILEAGDEGEATATLPAGSYLRVRFHGMHDNAAKSYQQLIQFCEDHLLTITGDAVETALIDYGITNDYAKYVTEIRLPVR
ncbi:MerR family transcriptional regulator [Companilactobacillus nodensis]|uniref:Transcription regulator of multidrug-efflux transporter n=1 Tax=Companilactobacillus nodensis DSM 19682 = JCM 14932 = NBRC 107160 TaxID=1423775 RepID=A0A0R1K838_9LACO|nr:MerR family transcriptional regulator [Companilactobacillus nodensis]KRK79830.1 transcription regulator of multidrug-efflux transporter [Companilactobacillus nodensis DSM 19682 = JCM 14932 = NBRC 107160]